MAANRHDEWGIFALGETGGDPIEERLTLFEQVVRTSWEEGESGEHHPLDLQFTLRRNIAFGSEWSKIVRDPVRMARAQERAFETLSQEEREMLAQLPVETVRMMRDKFRKGGADVESTD
jgi:hypothetical protein